MPVAIKVERISGLAAALSISRVGVGVFVLAQLSAAQSSYLVLPAVVLAALSDWLDGKIARRAGRAGATGRMIDNGADAVFLALVFWGFAGAEVFSHPLVGSATRYWPHANWLPLLGLGASFGTYLLRGYSGRRRGLPLLPSPRGHAAGVANYVLALIAAAAVIPGVYLSPFLMEPAFVTVVLLNVTAAVENLRLSLFRGVVAPMIVAVAIAATGLSACTPVSKSYEIHTAGIDCAQANRVVHDSVLSMNMVVTAFRLAKPGTDGYVRATRTDNRGTLNGRVGVSCDATGVHIVAEESGFGGDHEFERGIFLSVTGRAGLRVENGRILDGGGLGGHSRASADAASPPASKQPAKVKPPARAKPRVAEKVVGVVVKLEPLHGFATVLDFEADLSAAGILPVAVTVANGTSRAYEFDPRDLLLRRRGSRRRTNPLSTATAVDLLLEKNRQVLTAAALAAAGEGAQPSEVELPDPMAPSELGDVRMASRIIRQRLLRGGLLRPGARFNGFLYYPVADYDRARIIMIDVATGETEGFIVDF